MKITEDKYIEILEIQGISYNKNSKWFTVSLERINEAIDYTRCCTTFTADEVVNELKENETLDDAISFFTTCLCMPRCGINNKIK